MQTIKDTERREMLETARKDIEHFTRLRDNPDWQRLVAIGNNQVDWRISQVMSRSGQNLRPEDMSDDWEKGVVAGIKLMLRIPELAVAQAELTLEQEEEQDENSKH